VLIESIEGIEDIKALRAQGRFLASGLLAWTQEAQQLVWLGIMVVGAYQVMDSSMTVGSLTACSILGTRAISPFAQLGVVFSRWQQAKVAKEALEDLMKRPTDTESSSVRAARQ
jgi:ATP-binding cassette subfamily C protein LapB